MLTTYRRHRRSCEHRSEGRKYRRCRCPIWVDGTLDGREIRKSLGIINWEKAQALVREWEAEGADESEGPISIETALTRFLADCQARSLSLSTLRKYRTTLDQLLDHANRKGLRSLEELGIAALRDFRGEWKDGALSAQKKIERLRAFFRFAVENSWVDDNPARLLKSPQVKQRPTLPFTREEMTAILAACERYVDNYGRTGQVNAKRLRAFVLLLRYGGLRISDAATLRRNRIEGGRLFLYTAKTNVPVYCPLPAFVVDALEATAVSDRYFFWSGSSRVETASGNWRRSLAKLFQLAEVSGGHPHRFRDTFAVELLNEGVPIEQLAALLGHSSIRITERHYAPWVRSRQDQLDATVRRVLARDPLAFSETKGTPEVHGKRHLPN